MKKLIPVVIILCLLTGAKIVSKKQYYYLECVGACVYVIDQDSTRVAKLDDNTEDPDSMREVFETQIGQQSILKASEMYFYILED